MLAATRRWFRRNRTPLAIGVGVVGAGYVVTSYVVGKLRDARERMSSDRIAKENLRRRFEQNQEDCTFTVLALLPTATANILEVMDTEKITYEIQQMKGSALARARSIGSTSPPSTSDLNATDDDGRSIITVSAQSEGGVQATTQLSVVAPSSTTAVSEGAAAASTSAQPDAPAPAPPAAVASKPRKTKRQLWDELTISSITRAYTLLYTLSLLTMLTRIQLNLLGRRSYLSSVVSLATGGNVAPGTISLENNDDDNAELAYGTDFEVNRKYLTFSWWLLNRGWVDVMQRVEAAVRQVFGHLSPRDTVTLGTFAKLSHDVRSLVEGTAPTEHGQKTAWLAFLLPPPDMEEYVLRESGVLDSDPLSEEDAVPSTPAGNNPTPPSSPSTAASLRRLLDETADLIESPHFAHVHTQILNAGFSTLLEHKLGGGIFDPLVGATPSTSSASTSAPPLSATTPFNDPLSSALGGSAANRAVLLPKITSVLTRQAHVIGHGMPNEYLQAMEAVPDLEGFAAVVYSSNWQAEVVPDDGAGAPESGSTPRDAKSPVVSSGPGRETSGGQQDESVVLVDHLSTSATAVDESGLFDSVWEKASASK
ncbi:Peroxin-3 [Dichotomopilus funicola]|uniref:Peroxin-3 n=1 Tax=Dichotomopilus funicola TaxID=1934379 RepID=A0AAN6V319_9PEZI|nr:Peroxin-3 [Dichotomopilus funicola]